MTRAKDGFGTTVSNETIAHYIPELKDRMEFFEQCFNDLVTRGLIEKSARERQLITLAGPFAGRVSSLGNDFLKFISSPRSDEK